MISKKIDVRQSYKSKLNIEERSWLKWTKSNNTLELITLQVYTENAAGINLYKNLGFEEVGVIPNFIKDNGRYYNNMSMWLGVR